MSYPSGDSAAQIWEATLGQLLLRVTRQNYEAWLRSTAGLRFEGTTLVVAAASELACDWLATRMRSVIQQALLSVAGSGLQVRFETTEQVLLATAAGGELQPALIASSTPQLNPRLTFATFMEAGFNRLALSAAREIATSPYSAYSPLFISGARGNGKTHLLHAAAQEARVASKRVLLVSADQFLNEYTTAIRNRNGAAFRARFRDLDLLGIDDVHILVGKKATLTEFYQTLAWLHDHGRQAIVAGDLSSMNGEADRFQHQLQWGLVARIEAATAEDRGRFLERRAAQYGIALPQEVIQYLAIRIKSSIRDLEGAVNRVVALAQISQDALTIDFVAKALQPVEAEPFSFEAKLHPGDVVTAVCSHLKVNAADICSGRRERPLTYARHVAMYILRQDIGLTYAVIAATLGRKDHSTVVHACSQIHRELSVSAQLRADIDAIRHNLRSKITAA